MYFLKDPHTLQDRRLDMHANSNILNKLNWPKLCCTRVNYKEQIINQLNIPLKQSIYIGVLYMLYLCIQTIDKHHACTVRWGTLGVNYIQ